MNPILEWLSGGDLRSDGMADEVAAVVLKTPQLFEEIYAGLDQTHDVIRARTADTLEKISRAKPELLKDHLPQLVLLAKEDPVAMVRMHLAMIFGHLSIYEELVEDLISTLLHMLDDHSVFTKSWAIVSLCIIARKYPTTREQIVSPIVALQNDSSTAIRTKVRYARGVLTDEGRPFPKGWIKSEHLEDLNR
jgi:HEAT repeat protein